MNYGRNHTSRQRVQMQAKEAKKRRKNKTAVHPLKIILLVFLGIGIIGLLAGGILFKALGAR